LDCSQKWVFEVQVGQVAGPIEPVLIVLSVVMFLISLLQGKRRANWVFARRKY
jgi:hypothetical protein